MPRQEDYFIPRLWESYESLSFMDIDYPFPSKNKSYQAAWRAVRAVCEDPSYITYNDLPLDNGLESWTHQLLLTGLLHAISISELYSYRTYEAAGNNIPQHLELFLKTLDAITESAEDEHCPASDVQIPANIDAVVAGGESWAVRHESAPPVFAQAIPDASLSDQIDVTQLFLQISKSMKVQSNATGRCILTFLYGGFWVGARSSIDPDIHFYSRNLLHQFQADSDTDRSGPLFYEELIRALIWHLLGVIHASQPDAILDPSVIQRLEGQNECLKRSKALHEIGLWPGIMLLLSFFDISLVTHFSISLPNFLSLRSQDLRLLPFTLPFTIFNRTINFLQFRCIPILGRSNRGQDFQRPRPTRGRTPCPEVHISPPLRPQAPGLPHRATRQVPRHWGILLARVGDPIQDEDVQPHITAIIEAVSQFHQAGIHHHDLRLDNITVDGAGRIFILDFGRAVHADQCSDTSRCPDQIWLEGLAYVE
ncbi:hypothetical protein D9615_009341 [Tricholomella constricta]|uniref:Non-specific serine/threonine protein kinase n=1 Tax=Tricholomella constricta TaxID=117010 RepID=A0A8H5LZY0_9AGAR|nr:hypothetical protein D9615_009341 [Tricholomella constricta]